MLSLYYHYNIEALIKVLTTNIMKQFLNIKIFCCVSNIRIYLYLSFQKIKKKTINLFKYVYSHALKPTHIVNIESKNSNVIRTITFCVCIEEKKKKRLVLNE